MKYSAGPLLAMYPATAAISADAIHRFSFHQERVGSSI
jgi:hypothetical protein